MSESLSRRPLDVMEAGAGRGAPGDPRHMGPEVRQALESVLTGEGLQVRQQKEWGEILTGWETRNRYDVRDARTGHTVLLAGETGGGLVATLLRNFWPFRTVELELRSPGGAVVLAVRRPWTLFFARFEVEAWDGRPLAVLQQRFRLFGRRFDITTPGGAVLGTIEGAFFRPWTFQVMQRDVEVATIRKRWSGLLKEAFTDADSFGVQFSPTLTDARLRQVALAATLALDLVYFEQRRGAGGVAGVLGELVD